MASLANFLRPGVGGMLKEGTKHLSGVEEAVLKNIEACKDLASIVRTSMGPNGMNKMVLNHTGKVFVTTDAATIMKELDVIHPAAKMMVMAAQSQERDPELIRQGLHPSEIIQGYQKGYEKALQVLETLVTTSIPNLRDKKAVCEALRSCIASKQYGLEDLIASLVAEACISVLPSDERHFNVDNIRVSKVLGGSLPFSTVVHGTVVSQEAAGSIKSVQNAKVAIYSCDFDIENPETKGTVLIKNATELQTYNRSEEDSLEKKVKDIAESGVTVVVSPKFGDLALHFLERYKIMAVKCSSKVDLRRIARSCGAAGLTKVEAPDTESIGFCDSVMEEEISSTKMVVFRQKNENSRVATILLRGGTENMIDDVERAIDDAVNVFKVLTRDNRFVPGAGATEIELARQISSFGDKSPGLDQYAIKKYAESLEVFPRTLAENAGLKATDVVSRLYAVHTSGQCTTGIDIEASSKVREDITDDAKSCDIYDSLATKKSALTLATQVATTVLKIDQIIMAKQAGGPKPQSRDADADDAA
ncbi:T-complex protein 1 subunit theta [Galdieria sulphuraria]|nr:T-complex protein 1 subunit theta [Galdieria sulphuraria]